MAKSLSGLLPATRPHPPDSPSSRDEEKESVAMSNGVVGDILPLVAFLPLGPHSTNATPPNESSVVAGWSGWEWPISCPLVVRSVVRYLPARSSRESWWWRYLTLLLYLNGLDHTHRWALFLHRGNKALTEGVAVTVISLYQHFQKWPLRASLKNLPETYCFVRKKKEV